MKTATIGPDLRLIRKQFKVNEPLLLILFLRNSEDDINSLLSSEISSSSSSSSSLLSSASTAGANLPNPSVVSGGLGTDDKEIQ